MSALIDVLKIFEQFPTEAPKNLRELEEFEEKCRKAGKESLAEWLWEWRISLEYHIYREHDDAEQEYDYNDNTVL